MNIDDSFLVISDVHLQDSNDYINNNRETVLNAFFKALEKFIIEHSYWKPQKVLIVGDLVYSISRGNVVLVREFLKRIQELTKIEFSNFIFCLGNHEKDLKLLDKQISNKQKECVDRSEQLCKKLKGCQEKISSHDDIPKLASDLKVLEDNVDLLVQKVKGFQGVENNAIKKKLNDLHRIEIAKCLENPEVEKNRKKLTSFYKGFTKILEDLGARKLKSRIFGDNFIHGVIDLSDEDIIVVVLNSGWCTTLGDNYGNMKIGSKLLEDVESMIFDIKQESGKDNLKVLTLMHHPLQWFDWGERYGSNRITSKLLPFSDLIITGHEHVAHVIPDYHGNSSQILNLGTTFSASHTSSPFYQNSFLLLKVNLPNFQYVSFKFNEHKVFEPSNINVYGYQMPRKGVCEKIKEVLDDKYIYVPNQDYSEENNLHKYVALLLFGKKRINIKFKDVFDYDDILKVSTFYNLDLDKSYYVFNIEDFDSDIHDLLKKSKPSASVITYYKSETGKVDSVFSVFRKKIRLTQIKNKMLIYRPIIFKN